MEHLILEVISKCVEEKKIIRNNLHGFMKEKSCLIKPIDFYDSLTYWRDEGRVVDAAYLIFSKAFDTIL